MLFPIANGGDCGDVVAAKLVFLNTGCSSGTVWHWDLKLPDLMRIAGKTYKRNNISPHVFPSAFLNQTNEKSKSS